VFLDGEGMPSLVLEFCAGPPPPVEGRSSYNPIRVIKMWILWRDKCGDPKGLAVKMSKQMT